MLKLKFAALSVCAVITAAAVTAAFAPAAGAAEWRPRKPVELVVMAGAGGGADQIAGMLQKLIRENNLSPHPFIPVNKPDGSGAEALKYMQNKAGDDHTLMVTLNSFYTAPLTQKDLNVDVSRFTPVARMALDTFLLWVNTDSGINDLDTYIARVKSAGGGWKAGGTGMGQEDSILTAMMEAEFGYEVTYIPFPGGGTAAKILADGHIDSTVNNPSEQSEFHREGATKPLVQFTPERMAVYPDVPTARELGHDIVYFMQRSINGPPDMSKSAQDWYISLFKLLFNSRKWRNFCKAEGLTCDTWMAGPDLAAFHAEQIEIHKNLINNVGAGAVTGR